MWRELLPTGRFQKCDRSLTTRLSRLGERVSGQVRHRPFTDFEEKIDTQGEESFACAAGKAATKPLASAAQLPSVPIGPPGRNNNEMVAFYSALAVPSAVITRQHKA